MAVGSQYSRVAGGSFAMSAMNVKRSKLNSGQLLPRCASTISDFTPAQFDWLSRVGERVAVVPYSI